jgi:hypothetical protein
VLREAEGDSCLWGSVRRSLGAPPLPTQQRDPWPCFFPRVLLLCNTGVKHTPFPPFLGWFCSSQQHITKPIAAQGQGSLAARCRFLMKLGSFPSLLEQAARRSWCQVAGWEAGQVDRKMRYCLDRLLIASWGDDGRGQKAPVTCVPGLLFVLVYMSPFSASASMTAAGCIVITVTFGMYAPVQSL